MHKGILNNENADMTRARLEITYRRGQFTDHMGNSETSCEHDRGDECISGVSSWITWETARLHVNMTGARNV